MRLGRRLGPWFAHMRDIVIDLLVEGHDPADRAHGEVWSRQQTPDAELAGIGMAFLEMIHLDHHGKPHLARGLGARVCGP